MGFSISMGGKETVRSEPNVVPLCDVLLVLLIIFMIVTPLIQKGVDVRLPNAQFTSSMPESPDVVLAVKKDARDPKGYLLFVNQNKVTLETLQNALEEEFLTVSERKLYLKVDQEIEYGVFAEFLWDTIRAAGIESVGIITEKKTEKGD
ncbi:MAG: biopolymer transporter ExbD [Candidatus Aminicenantes bacterium]|nr:biopolymer transporter ExbD [Candidatus Aminicenantes bacterium]NTV79885.1 biopolymer transporter ExbD [Candidatus Aminicenantes bacterium]